MINIDKVTPARDLVVIRLLNLEEIYTELITLEQSDESTISIRYGEVMSLGPIADSKAHCPGLEIGDKVIFSEFSGYFIAASDDENIYKVIRGYDIVGKYMKGDISDIDSLTPTGDRVLVELMDLTQSEDGVIITASDPKLADLSYGKILECGSGVSKLDLKENDSVAFAPYVGTDVRHYESDNKKALKIIVEHDILFTV